MASDLLLVIVAITADGLLAFNNDPFLSVDPNSSSSKGSDFYVAFLPNSGNENQSENLYPELLISTDDQGLVTFTVSVDENLPGEMRNGYPLTASVSYGEVFTVRFHQDFAVETSTEETNSMVQQSNAIRVQTHGGKKITVQGVSGNDGFIAFPCDSMTNEGFTQYEYLVLAADQDPSADVSSLALVIPCYNNTVITVEPSRLVTFTGQHSLPNPSSAIQAGPRELTELTTFTANEGQTLLITHSNDLSGTIVRSNNPVVLLSGHECGQIHLSATGCGHMMEQMPPGLTFGTRFFLVPTAGSVSGDYFRVGTLTNGTRISVTCATSPDEEPQSIPLESDGVINRGDFIAFMTPGIISNIIPSYCCLSATNPVLVAQYSTTSDTLDAKDNTDFGDPLMSIVPPVTQYLNNYTTTSPVELPGPFPFRYISLSIAARFFNNSAQDQGKVKLNDETVEPIDGWIPIYCSNINVVCGYGAQVEVPSGDIRVYHEDPEVGLGVFYYAFQEHNSYAIAQGYELTPIAATRVMMEDIEISENVGTVVINVSRYGDLTVDSEGILNARPTAPEEADSSDYVEFSPVFISYTGGDIQQDTMSFTIEIINDDIPEPSRESFEIVGVARKNLFFPLPIITITIIDDDEVVVGFLPESYRVSEAEAVVTITIVKRTQAARRVTLQVSTEDGSALSSRDYTSVMAEVVFETMEVVKEVQVPILQDTVAEGVEMFRLILVAPEEADMVAIHGDGLATVSIEDDDSAVVEFVGSEYTVAEGDGVVKVCIRIDGQVADEAIVRLIALPDTAEAGLDYIPGILNFVNFQPPGDSVACSAIEVVDDRVALEEEERFLLFLIAVGGQIMIGEMSQTTVIIHDNDDLVVELARDGFTVSEDDCNIEICLIKNMDTAETLTIDVFISEVPPGGNRATAGSDFVTVNTTISFSPTERESCVTIEIVDDDVPNELPEEIILNLSVNQTKLSLPPVSVTILDNDAADGRVCVVTETLIISPFNRNDFYQFEGLCDHYLLRLCDAMDELSVTADFPSATLGSARVGLRYRESSVVSTETGELILNNLSLLTTIGGEEIYSNGFVVSRGSGVNRITMQLEGNITVVHMYGGDDRSIQVVVTEGLSFGGTDVPSLVSVCGLCGNMDGTLLQADLMTVADINNVEQIGAFIESYVVVATEQFLRGQRRECSAVINDTVIGDPVFTVPLKDGSVLCYDIRGQPGSFLNLISDKCTSVSADYEAMDIPENGNIMRAVGIRAVSQSGACHNIEVRINGTLTTTVDDTEISGVFVSGGVRVRAYSDRVRVSVPNCDLVDLVMWLTRDVTNGQAMLRFQVSRGYNLSPTSHGLIGQFWNTPVSIEPYTGPVNEDYGEVDRNLLYLITVQGRTKSRSFLGEYSKTSWDRAGPCYYAGDAEGGKSGVSDDYGSVIEGKYTDYKVARLFSDEFSYTQFENKKCT